MTKREVIYLVLTIIFSLAYSASTMPSLAEYKSFSWPCLLLAIVCWLTWLTD